MQNGLPPSPRASSSCRSVCHELSVNSYWPTTCPSILTDTVWGKGACGAFWAATVKTRASGGK